MLKRPWFMLSRHEGEAEEPPTPGEGGEAKPVKTFTQDDIDRIVADRLARQRSSLNVDDLKAKADRLDVLEAEKLSAEEKATQRAEAAEKAAAERDRKTSERIATAELKAALTGLVDNPAEVIDDLNLAKFIGEDGEVDADAVEKVKAKFAAIAKKANIPGGDLDQGGRGDGKPLNFRTATKEQVDAENKRLGISRW